MVGAEGAGSKREAAALARRKLIVETAAELFVVKGFHQTSVRDIAQHAGISLGNLYNHFGGKEELIAEIAFLEASELEGLGQTLASNDDPERVVDRFVNGYLTYVSQPENAVLAAEITAEALRNPAIAKGFNENRDRLATALARVLKHGVADGQFHRDLNTTESAHLILDLIEGLALRSVFSDRKEARAARRAVMDMIERSLRAEEKRRT